MLKRFIDFHLRHRLFVLAGLIGLIAAGVTVMLRIPIDAFPDLTNNQVVVITNARPWRPPK
jgi:cobalt-zinc-cadmium resistance protein CzcA